MADSKKKTTTSGFKIKTEVRNTKGDQLADDLTANEMMAIKFVGTLIEKHYQTPGALSQAIAESLDIISRVARGTVLPSVIPEVNAVLVRIASSERVINVMEETRVRTGSDAQSEVSYH